MRSRTSDVLLQVALAAIVLLAGAAPVVPLGFRMEAEFVAGVSILDVIRVVLCVATRLIVYLTG